MQIKFIQFGDIILLNVHNKQLNYLNIKRSFKWYGLIVLKYFLDEKLILHLTFNPLLLFSNKIYIKYQNLEEKILNISKKSITTRNQNLFLKMPKGIQYPFNNKLSIINDDFNALAELNLNSKFELDQTINLKINRILNLNDELLLIILVSASYADIDGN